MALGTEAPPHGRFIALDSLRGVAAVTVMLYHFGDYGYISGLALIRHGYIFVDFFFVLSGFVIAAAYGQRLARGFSRRTFMFLRLGRIYPLHIAVVAAFAVAKLASGRSLFEGSHGVEYLGRAIFLLDGYAAWEDLNFYNGASWSISVELAAYGLAAILFGRGRAGLAVAVCIWLVAAAAYVTGIDWVVLTDMLQRGVIGFGLGAATWALFKSLEGHPLPLPVSVAEGIVLAVSGALVALLGIESWRLLVCDLAFALVVLVFARDGGIFARALHSASMRALGRWSYSIYMNHLFVIAVCSQLMLLILPRLGRADALRSDGAAGFENFDFGAWGNTAVTLAVTAAVIALSALTYRFIEKPGRQWARDKARRRGAAASEAAAPTF